ncbi:MAG: hypothetical protein QG661_2662 [Actinomycetota bacterium]|nr:hypothetical protein [Actinomycetota bacterium]
MTSFLLEYNRRNGELHLQPFAEPGKAMAARMEREASAGPDIEIVVLSSDSEESLRRTHSRYFQSVPEILRSSSDALRAS